MSTFSDLWRKFAKSKKYREEFVAAQVKRGIPFQIRALMKEMGWSQEDLATRSELSQGVVSRAADLNYGNLTLNTIIKIAAGLDVAFVGRFVPFSELAKWFTDLSEESVRVKTFEQENREFRNVQREQLVTLALGAAESATPKKPTQSAMPLGPFLSDTQRRYSSAIDRAAA